LIQDLLGDRGGQDGCLALACVPAKEAAIVPRLNPKDLPRVGGGHLDALRQRTAGQADSLFDGIFCREEEACIGAKPIRTIGQLRRDPVTEMG